MPKSRIILALGFIIALLPILGFPHAWESFFQIFAGLGIVLLSVLISIDKRLSLRSKAEKRLARKREVTQAQVAEQPAAPSVRFGRRATDQLLKEEAARAQAENNERGAI